MAKHRDRGTEALLGSEFLTQNLNLGLFFFFFFFWGGGGGGGGGGRWGECIVRRGMEGAGPVSVF